MPINIYTSTDASAPALNALEGSLIDVLTGCLVTGYGSKAAAGWTKPYTSGTGTAVFRQTGGSGCYLRVNELVISSTYRSAQLLGYKTMSSVSLGTNRFPSETSLLGGIIVTKSIHDTNQQSNPRWWMVIADTRAFYLFINSSSTTSHESYLIKSYFFGDIVSYKASDSDCCVIAGSSVTHTNTFSEHFSALNSPLSNTNYFYSSSISSVATTMYINRAYTGLQESEQCQLVRFCPMNWNYELQNVIGDDITSMAGPDPITGTAVLLPLEVMEDLNIYRGKMPGYFEVVGGANTVAAFNSISGSGNLSGLTFYTVHTTNSNSASDKGSLVAVQTSGSWY